MTLDFKRNESMSEINKAISLHNGGKIWTATNWYKPKLSNSGRRSQLKINLIHVSAPPIIISTLRSTPGYPNWTTVDSWRGRKSPLAHPPPVSPLCLYKTDTHREHREGLQRYFSCGWPQWAVQTAQHVFDPSSL